MSKELSTEDKKKAARQLLVSLFIAFGEDIPAVYDEESDKVIVELTVKQANKVRFYLNKN